MAIIEAINVGRRMEREKIERQRKASRASQPKRKDTRKGHRR